VAAFWRCFLFSGCFRAVVGSGVLHFMKITPAFLVNLCLFKIHCEATTELREPIVDRAQHGRAGPGFLFSVHGEFAT
jgi:hypothetical protein